MQEHFLGKIHIPKRRQLSICKYRQLSKARAKIQCRGMGDVDSVPFGAPDCHLDESLTVSVLHQQPFKLMP